MFDFDLSDELKVKIRKLLRKDRNRVEFLNKKIKEVVANTPEGIDRYKNLRHDLKHLKRVHIDRSFVLVFKVDKENSHILFLDLDHHDNIYKKR
ncbi:MAG: addiction module toxin RelE [Candidatus Altiarchaeota archaeon]